MSAVNPILFIVGVPRSGTTLLRELVSNHSQIEIPPAELQLIPKLMALMGEEADFTDSGTVKKFVEVCQRANFNLNLEQSGISVDWKKLERLISGADWCTAVRALICCCCGNKNVGLEDDTIYGEKTPANLMSIGKFSRVLGNCRFIHIVRDPRDVCSSMRKAWGKTIYRGAARWARYMKYYDNLPELTKKGCMVVRYEDLVAKPMQEIERICEFLGIGFESKMLKLRNASEFWGDAAGNSEIQMNKKRKYADNLTASEIKRIEEVSWSFLQRYGYEPEQAQEGLEVSNVKYAVLGPIDFARGTFAQIRRKGLRHGIKYRLKQLF